MKLRDTFYVYKAEYIILPFLIDFFVNMLMNVAIDTIILSKTLVFLSIMFSYFISYLFWYDSFTLTYRHHIHLAGIVFIPKGRKYFKFFKA